MTTLTNKLSPMTWAGLALSAGAVVLALAWLRPWGPDASEPAFVAPMQALAAASVPVLAQVAGVSVDQMRVRLMAAGLNVQTDTDSVAQLSDGSLQQQMRLLGQVLRNPQTASADR